MKQEPAEPGPITRYLMDDHHRLDALLQATVADPDKIDHSAYAQFRTGLLRHIGMEEKILLPSAQRLRGGQPLPMAAKLRLDHGALASLLMPTPTPAIVTMIRCVLVDHNVLEEGPAGLYETCEQLAKVEGEQLLSSLKAAPEVNVLPYSDSPAVMNTLQRALERAGYQSLI